MSRQIYAQIEKMTEPLAQEHDTEALWKMFHGELWGFARRHLDSDAAADDVLQTAFLRAHPRGKDGRVRYDLRGQFGADPAELRQRFAFYVERFGVRVEV